MNGLAGLATIALATWRLSELIGWERGPFALLVRLREAAGVYHDEDGKPTSYPETELGRWLECPWCRTIALGVVVVLLWRWARWPVEVLAASAGALAFGKWFHGTS